MHLRNRRRVPLGILTIIGLTGWGDQSLAQTQTSTRAEEIIVTGSRIGRSKLSTPVPVVSIDAQRLEGAGTLFLSDILAQTPQIQPDLTSANSVRLIGGTGFGGANLRNLGGDRTLVLVNGRRHVGGLALSTDVDLNTIPIDLVERFDVVTGGASAIYGADAVAGVINIILKDNFEGFIGRAQYGVSERGDAESLLLSTTAGGFFAEGRGHAALSFEYTRRSRLSVDAREFSRRETRFLPNPDDADTADEDDGRPDDILVENGGINFLNRDGVIFPNSPDAITFNPDGSLRPFNYGGGDLGGEQIGGDFLRLRLDDLLPEQERFIATALSTFKLHEYIEAYSEAKFVLTTGRGASAGQPSFDFGGDALIIQRDNAFLPSELATTLDAGGLSSVSMNRFNLDLGQRDEIAERLTLRAAGGFRGEINQNLSYDIGITWGRTESISRANANRVNERFLASMDAVVDADGVVGRPGEIVCRIALQDAMGETPTLPGGNAAPQYLVEDGRAAQCVPTSVFGNGAVGEDAAAYINSSTTLRSIIEQTQLMGFVSLNSKDIFELPGGPISLVLGGEYRRDDASQYPDLADSLNLTFFNAINPSTGVIEVGEAFGELALPLLGGLPGIEELTVSAGGRISRYNLEEVGTVITTQVNGVYRPIDDIAFRASYSQSIRAPTIGDAFSAESQGFGFVNDPCDDENVNDGEASRSDNCTALAEQIGSSYVPGTSVPDESTRELVTGGNPNLIEETSTSWTAGVALNPRWIPNLLLNVDYWSFDIEDAISAPDAQRIANNCVDLADIDNQFCDLIDRDPGNFEITRVRVASVNLAAIEVRGLDFGASYSFKMQDLIKFMGVQKKYNAGALNLNLNGTFLERFTNFPTPTDPNERQDLAGFEGDPDIAAGLPQWRINLTGNYALAAFTFTYRFQWIDSFNLLNDQQTFDNNPDAQDPLFTGEKGYHYIQARYRFFNHMTAYVGIDNVFDTLPPSLFNGSEAAAGFYDNIGRSYYMGLRWDNLF